MERIRLLTALAVFGVLLAPAHAAAGRNAPRVGPLALLSQTLSAPTTVSYTGVIEVVRIGHHAAEFAVYRVEHRAPDLTRRVYSAPSTIFGDAVISRGDVDFSVDAQRHRIVETRVDSTNDRLALTNNGMLLRENYRAVEKGNEIFDGRQTVNVLLINKYSNRPSMLVRIDRATKILLDKQRFDTEGALVSEVRFEQVRYAAVAPAEFELPNDYPLVQGAEPTDVPRDPDDVVRKCGFAARKPQGIPEGFSPVEGSLDDLSGVRTVHLLYSDGLRTFSLFESVAAASVNVGRFNPQPALVHGHDAQYAEDGAVALMTWSDGTLHYTLVGELDRSELRRIAATITP